MKPRVSPEFREIVAEIVRFPGGVIGSQWTPPYAPPFNSALPDVQHFRSQRIELTRRSVSQFAASFRDDGPDGDSLLVLVQVPDLTSVEESYQRLLSSLQKSNFLLEKLDWERAEEIFVDRLSEFLSMQSSSVPQSTSKTIVNSNRAGDTVIYAKGFFISTGTAFGMSTPAVGYLSQGRYSFGIMDSGNPRFDNIVWSCPATVRLDLP
jgi:hypothetical protein